ADLRSILSRGDRLKSGNPDARGLVGETPHGGRAAFRVPLRPSPTAPGEMPVKTIDYIYRFDPKNPSVKQHPPDAEAARRTLEDGNRMFSSWMESCRTSTPTTGTEPQYVVPCNGLEVGMLRSSGEMPRP